MATDIQAKSTDSIEAARVLSLSPAAKKLGITVGVTSADSWNELIEGAYNLLFPRIASDFRHLKDDMKIWKVAVSATSYEHKGMNKIWSVFPPLEANLLTVKDAVHGAVRGVEARADYVKYKTAQFAGDQAEAGTAANPYQSDDLSQGSGQNSSNSQSSSQQSSQTSTQQSSNNSTTQQSASPAGTYSSQPKAPQSQTPSSGQSTSNPASGSESSVGGQSEPSADRPLSPATLAQKAEDAKTGGDPSLELKHKVGQDIPKLDAAELKSISEGDYSPLDKRGIDSSDRILAIKQLSPTWDYSQPWTPITTYQSISDEAYGVTSSEKTTSEESSTSNQSQSSTDSGYGGNLDQYGNLSWDGNTEKYSSSPSSNNFNNMTQLGGGGGNPFATSQSSSLVKGSNLTKTPVEDEMSGRMDMSQSVSLLGDLGMDTGFAQEIVGAITGLQSDIQGITSINTGIQIEGAQSITSFLGNAKGTLGLSRGALPIGLNLIRDFNPGNLLNMMPTYNNTSLDIGANASFNINVGGVGVGANLGMNVKQLGSELVSQLHEEICNRLFAPMSSLFPDMTNITVPPKSYVHSQTEESDKWVIPARTSGIESVSSSVEQIKPAEGMIPAVFDKEGFRIQEDECYIDDKGNTVLTFNQPVSGRAVLSTMTDIIGDKRKPTEKAIEAIASQKLTDLQSSQNAPKIKGQNRTINVSQQASRITPKLPKGAFTGKVDSSKLDLTDRTTNKLVQVIE